MVGVATINGKEYRLLYGMTLAERFGDLTVEKDGDKLKVKKPSTKQVLTCIIYHGHENWCDDNDEPNTLVKKEVAQFIEKAYLTKDEAVLKQFDIISSEWIKSEYVEDLIKVGKEAEDKKKELTGTTLSESPSENSDLNPGSTNE